MDRNITFIIDPLLKVDEQLAESAIPITDKVKTSLYKKSKNSGISVDILEEVYSRGYNLWNDDFKGTREQFAFDRVNSFISGGFASDLDKDLLNEESLHDWFSKSKSKSGKKGWVQVGGKYDGEACARQPGQKTTPKCRPSWEASKMSKTEKKYAHRKKQEEDPNQPQKSDAAKPTYVKTYKEENINEIKNVLKAAIIYKRRLGKETKDLIKNPNMSTLDKIKFAATKAGMEGHETAEKMIDYPMNIVSPSMGALYGLAATLGKPITDMSNISKKLKNRKKTSKITEDKDACYHKVKARYKVWPSAYASGALVKCRKAGAKNWGNKSVKEETELNKKVLTIREISKKYDVPVDYVKEQLKVGISVEKEHTSDSITAKRIALAHLSERPDYYKKLKKVGLEEGFNDRRDVIDSLKKNGFVLHKEGGDHQKWRHPPSGIVVAVPRHRTFSPNVAGNIRRGIKQAGGKLEESATPTAEKQSKDPNKSSSRFDATNSLVRNYIKNTPRQNIEEEEKKPVNLRRVTGSAMAGILGAGLGHTVSQLPGSDPSAAALTAGLGALGLYGIKKIGDRLVDPRRKSKPKEVKEGISIDSVLDFLKKTKFRRSGRLRKPIPILRKAVMKTPKFSKTKIKTSKVKL